MDGDTVVGDVEFLPTQTGMEGPQFQKFQESYLKILLKFGVDRDLELHMKKKISFEFLQGLQLPLILKKEIINIKDEVNRLEFIKNIFNNILEADSKSQVEIFHKPKISFKKLVPSHLIICNIAIT